MQEAESQWLCDLMDCRLFLDKPITLPCGYTICMHHLDTFSSTFKCEICQEEHMIPQSGFQINKKLMKQIESKVHLSGLHKQTEKALEALKKNCEKISLTDPDELIYNYFLNIRNKIDLHREISINKINEKSDRLIGTLIKIENECKKNVHNCEKIDTNKINSIIFKIKNDLRNPNLTERQLMKHFDEILLNIIEIKNKKEDHEKRLLMNQLIEFSPLDNTDFGELVTKDKLKESSSYCHNLILSFDNNSNRSKTTASPKQEDQRFEKKLSRKEMFNFDKMVQKIKELDIKNEETLGEKSFAYDKNVSFFDHLSNEDNQKKLFKLNYKKERELNAVTFGKLEIRKKKNSRKY